MNVNDLIISQVANVDGPAYALRVIAPVAGGLLGTDGSKLPIPITLGANLSLVAGVLSATGGGSGTVTSVALTMPAFLSVAGSPITAAGTLAVTLATQAANKVFAGPTSGGAVAPDFRLLVAGDIPDLSGVYQPLSAKLTAFAALANAAGWLHNDGSGVLAYSTPTKSDVGLGNVANVAQVTAVSGSAPIVSSGGTTPAISIPQSNGTVDGYLSSTDWTTFNGKGSGSVTSVALSLPAIFTVSGSPVTGAGTLSAVLATQLANLVWAGPTTGAAAAPTFRSLVSADIPDLSGTYQPLNSKLTSISALASAAGWLHNDGSGTFTYSTPTATQIGATTVGGNLFALTNPSAITFIRINADNSVSTLDAATFRTAIGAGTGGGSVTSVALALPAMFTVSGSPVTTSGTLTAILATQVTKTFLAGPTSGADAAPTFRVIAVADVPTLNQDTTGSAAKWTTARLLAGNSVDGSANVAFANKFVVQGTADAGLSSAQFLGALGTGLVKNTTTTGVLSIASAGSDYVAPSAYASTNGLTMATARLLGRTTAGSGAAEEIQVSTGLSLSAGVLSCTVTAPVGANPSVSVGLTAVNGSAATFMRSDGAPALSQSIAPTWAGVHIFNAGNLTIQDTTTTAKQLIFASNSSTALGANRTLTFDVVNADRTIKLTGNPTLADWFDQSVKTTASPSHTALTLTTSLTLSSGSGSGQIIHGGTAGRILIDADSGQVGAEIALYGSTYTTQASKFIAVAASYTLESLAGTNPLVYTPGTSLTLVGTLGITSGAGIGGATAQSGGVAFPATQVSVSDVNTLDDYEEGTFTATLACGTSGTITLDGTLNTLAYTKVGRIVTITGLLEAQSVSSPLGSLILNTLPFAVASGKQFRTMGMVALNGANTTAVTSSSLIAIDGTTFAVIETRNAAGSFSSNASDIKAGTDFYIFLTYFAAT